MKKVVVLSIIILITFSALCHAKIVYVQEGGTGAGTSWVNAYSKLQYALQTAEIGDEILVAMGTYYPSVIISGSRDDRDKTFQMKNGVTVKGGYAGYGAANPNNRNIALYETILSGDLLGNDNPNTPLEERHYDPSRADNCYHIFYHPEGLNLDSTAVLDGFTIAASHGTGSHVFDQTGGGMYNDHSSPTIINCTFKDNFANRFGGGLYNEYSSPTVTNCVFTGNGGGGMDNWHTSHSTVTNCIFTDNINSGMKNITYSSPTVTNCIFTDNTDSGVYNGDSSPKFINCTFSGNSAINGGGINTYQGYPKLTNCVLAGNLADEDGGGIYNSNNNSGVSLTNCVLTGNSAGRDGGGICSENQGSSWIDNCIIWGNFATRYNDSIRGRSYLSYNCIQGGKPSGSFDWDEGNFDADPMFVDPGYWDPNGTPEIESDDFWVNGDYHLKSEGWRWDPHAYGSCDLNGNGIVNLADFASLANSWQSIGQAIPADINKSQTVDIDDLYFFAQQYLTPGHETGQWAWDDATSPCIDAGNPGSPLVAEPMTLDVDPMNRFGENLRINMGSYGGTAEASMPPYGWALLADMTNDGIVNLQDFAAQANDWLRSVAYDDQPGDLDRNDIVDIADLIILSDNWLEQTSWY